MVSRRVYVLVAAGFFLLLTADVATIVAESRFASPDLALMLEGFVNPLCRIFGVISGMAGVSIHPR